MKIHKFFSQISLFLVLFLGLTILPAAFAKTPNRFSALASRIRPCVVTILVYGYDGKMAGVGSGFFYNDRGDILTNSHVLIKNARAEIKTQSGKKYPVGAIIMRDEKRDIVKARTHVPRKTPYLKPAVNQPLSGENIMVVGSPMGLDQTVSEGIVSAWREIPGKGRLIQISAPISPGSSGGPVLDMDGRVVGIATFQSIKGQNLNFAVPVEDFFKSGSSSSSSKSKPTKLNIRKNKKGIIIIE